MSPTIDPATIDPARLVVVCEGFAPIANTAIAASMWVIETPPIDGDDAKMTAQRTEAAQIVARDTGSEASAYFTVMWADSLAVQLAAKPREFDAQVVDVPAPPVTGGGDTP